MVTLLLPLQADMLTLTVQLLEIQKIPLLIYLLTYLFYLLTYLLVKDALCEVFADVACLECTRKRN